MSNLFHEDNKLFQTVNKITDGFFVSFLWFLFSIPVVTAGASSTALYYTVHKTLRRNRGYIWSSFWSAFRSNFKQATKIWLLLACVFGFIYADFRITYEQLKQGMRMGFLCYFFLAVMLFAAVWSVYIFAYCARFENGIKAVLKNSALMAAAHLPWSLVVMVLLLAGAAAVFISPILIFAVPALLGSLFDRILEKIFRKYMLKEDLEKEDADFLS